MEQQMRQILAELELLSYGTTASWNPGGGQDDGDGRPAGGDVRPLHDVYRARYLAAETPEARAEVRRAARAALESQSSRTHREIVEETAAEVDARIEHLVRAGWSVKDIAVSVRCTPTRVRRVSAALPAEPDEATVLELAAQHLTVRNIAMRTGIPKSTVQRIMRRRQAA